MTELVRGIGLFLTWRHKLLCMNFHKDLIQCESVCDVKWRIDPCPLLARSWDRWWLDFVTFTAFKRKQNNQIKHNRLKIPTGRRQTSWRYTSVAKDGAWTQDLRRQRPKPLDHAASCVMFRTGAKIYLREKKNEGVMCTLKLKSLWGRAKKQKTKDKNTKLKKKKTIQNFTISRPSLYHLIHISDKYNMKSQVYTICFHILYGGRRLGWKVQFSRIWWLPSLLREGLDSCAICRRWEEIPDDGTSVRDRDWYILN